MENKDIDKYFKDRSDAFNEAPGDALWAKIEANIEAPVTPKGNTGKWLMGISGAVIIGAVATWFIVGSKDEITTPQQQQITTLAKDTVTQLQQDTVAQTENTDSIDPFLPAPITNTLVNIPQPVTPVAADIVEADIPDTDTNTVLNSNPAVISTPVVNSAVAGNGIMPRYYVNSGTQKGDTLAAAPAKNIPYDFELDERKDQIEVKVPEKLTRAERDKLIKSTVEKNAPYVGRKIIIKATGYRVYRHTISAQDSIKFSNARAMDPIKTPKMDVEIVTDTMYYDMFYLDTVAPKSDTKEFQLKKKPAPKN